MTPPRTPWLSGWRPSPAARLRLFCLPFAGGGSSVYHPWSSLLPTSVELCRVQLPGRESRLAEPALEDVRQLVPALGEALTPWFDLPFGVFGHSMGALIGFELIRWLQAQGRPTPRLFVASGHRAPHLPRRRRKIALLPEPEFLDELRRMRGTPEELLQNRELLELVLPTIRADIRLWENYEHQPAAPLTCPLVAYGGAQDELVPPVDLEPWPQYANQPSRVRIFPGDHFFVISARSAVVADLDGELRQVLARL